MKFIHFDEPKHTAKTERKIAKQILKVKPDAILFEFPKGGYPLEKFNKRKPKNKPKDLIEKWKKGLLFHSKKHKQLKRTVDIVKSIEKLWNQGNQIYLYEIDAPVELSKLGLYKRYSGKIFHNLRFWIWIFLRERIMVSNIRKIYRNLRLKIKNPKLLVKCHNFHWKNIKFLLRNPAKKNIYDYYFSKFSKYQIKSVLKREKVLYKFWKMYGI